ncbi:MAG: molybdopterin-dependent oxidoreductase, partial [Acidobacteriota bacterium]|nr:molybdopterin-dependent oxidoreductase [Acidobacteriota bacterium]
MTSTNKPNAPRPNAANESANSRRLAAKLPFWTRIKRALGFDIATSIYSYAHDPRFGFISESRVADTWTRTTCGYCSVGCGMLIGTNDGVPVASRGNPDHPVNRGKLCPKGLSEHLVLNAPGRATKPMLRKGGRGTPLEPVSWDEALDLMTARITALQREHGENTFGVVGTGQLLTEEFYTLGKLVQLGFHSTSYDGNT